MTNFLVFLSTSVQENQMYVSPFVLLSRDPWKTAVIIGSFLIYIILFIVIALYYSFYGYPTLSSKYKLSVMHDNDTALGCAAREVSGGDEISKRTLLTVIDFVEEENDDINRISPRPSI